MSQTHFSETLDYLYSLLPMYQRQGAKAFKKDLDNIQKLCWELGLPQWQFQSIHIAGTNGKGSVASMLNSILIESGLLTGLYTSPHLLSFTERIRVKGKEIPEKEVVKFVALHQDKIEAISPSFFELTVGMAFDYFARRNIDIAVIETGLGGRLDSTNIISPEISIITNISLDHQNLLGDTLPQIAEEKAGIIKKFTPVVVGADQEESMPVFLAKAGVVEAPLFCAQHRFTSSLKKWESNRQLIEVYDREEDESREYWLDLSGEYQMENLATVLMAVEVLREDGWEIPDKAIQRGLKKVKSNSGLRGRMELLEKEPKTFADTAHNEAGVKQAIDQIKSMDHKELHVVWGMVSDKDHDDILQLLPKDARYYWVRPDVPRGFDAAALASKAAGHDLFGGIFDSVEKGLAAARKAAAKEDLIYIGGSTFVVAEVIPVFDS
ncbi:MAG: folylpolyglutamate synthase/dihydrofolate synthase family protein [Bacteroidia bacterium]|nr:folylpolyglutamate synthase/dihydrofolate synthase family protein [Bacteroidia bacterium]